MQLRNYYVFLTINNVNAARHLLLEKGKALDIKGTILLSKEGINVALCGDDEKLDKIEQYIENLFSISIEPFITPLENDIPFKKYKVKIKPELIKLGEEVSKHLDMRSNKCRTGIYVRPEEWNELILDTDTVVIDTRNNYEYNLGHFKNALNPDISFFNEFPQYLRNAFADKKNTKIAMYCTGGIRCEKASYYMHLLGYTEIYQLEGGILNYFDQVDQKQSLWLGACFVFDDRVAIGQDMLPRTFMKSEIPDYSAIATGLKNDSSRHIHYVHKKIAQHLNNDT